MPCQRGAGCFRADLSPDEILPAAEVDAAVVFARSCSLVAVGAHAYSNRLSVALGFLDGTAVAVIGPVGVHIAQRYAEWEARRALAAGLPLGEVVHRVNASNYPIAGDLARFGLLGDPGLVVPVPARALPPEPVPDAATVDALTRLGVVLGRLDRLRWLDLPVPDEPLLAAHRRLREISACPYDPGSAAAVADLAADVSGIQQRIVDDLVEEIYVAGWNFPGKSLYRGGLRQVSSEPATCTSCGRATASVVTLQHRVDGDLHITTLQCRGCGEVWWTTEAGDRTIVLEGPVDVAATRTEPLTVVRVLANRGSRTVAGAVGYAFRSRRHFGLPPGWAQAYEVAPGATVRVEAPVDLTACAAKPDTHTMPFVGVIDGVYAASMVMLRVE
jgi:DNA-directed RNA polymerase subunit M/transcription elongation factor TFIIS